MCEYFFHSTLPNRLLYSLAVVMLFGRSTFSSHLEYNLAPLSLVCESPSSSDYTTQLLGTELVALAFILSVGDNRNSRRRVTFHVHWLRNCCTRIRLRVTADVTNQPSVKVFVTGNDYLTIIDYRHSLRSLLRLSL